MVAVLSLSNRHVTGPSALEFRSCRAIATIQQKIYISRYVMAFSIEELGRIDHLVGDWCIQRVPADIKNKLDHDYEIDGQAVTLLEVRPLWRGLPGEFTRRPFAKFRYVKTSGLWQIYWMRASGKWQAYEPDPVARDLDQVLEIIEADRYGCFFG